MSHRKAGKLVRDVATMIFYGGDSERAFPGKKTIVNEIALLNAINVLCLHFCSTIDLFGIETSGVPMGAENMIRRM